MSDVEPGAHRRIWEIGLAAIKDELGSEPVESLGDSRGMLDLLSI